MAITADNIVLSKYKQRRLLRRRARAESLGDPEYLASTSKREAESNTTPTVSNSDDGVYYDDQGKGYSIAPSIVKERNMLATNDGTLFTNKSGQGFSANPDTIITRYNQKPYNKVNKVYASGRTQSIEGTNSQTLLYGSVAVDSAKAEKRPSLWKRTKAGASKAWEDTSTGVSDFVYPYTPSVQKKVLNPGRELDFLYKKPTSKSVLEGDNIVSQSLSEGRDYFVSRPLDVGVAYAGGALFGTASKALPVLNNPWVGNSLKASYGASVAYNLDIAGPSERANILGREGVNMASFGLGSKPKSNAAQRNDLKMEFNTIKKKDLKVETIEFFKSRTSTKDLGGNVLELDDLGNPIMYSGTQTTKGGGLFKVGNKQYKASFTETGKSLNTPSGKVLTQSMADIKATQYEYLLDLRRPVKVSNSGMKLNFDRVATGKYASKMQTTSVITPKDNGALIDSLSVFESNGRVFRRFTQGQSVNVKDDTFFQGLSKDYYGTKGARKIAGSDKIVGGKSTKLLEVQEGDVTKALYYNTNAGQSFNELKLNFGKDLNQNVKTFRKEQFINSADNMLGLKTESKLGLQSATTEQSLKSVVANAARQDMIGQAVAKSSIRPTVNTLGISRKNSAATGLKLSRTSLTVLPAAIRTNIFPQEKATKALLNMGSSPKQSQDNTLKIGNVLKVGNNSRTRTRSNNTIRNIFTPVSTTRSLLGQDQQLKQSPALKQTQILKQTPGLRVNTGLRSFTPKPLKPVMIYPPVQNPKINRNPRYNPYKINTKLSVPKTKAGYNPSIEARIFNIKSKKVNIRLAKTGLTLRPILIK